MIAQAGALAPLVRLLRTTDSAEVSNTQFFKVVPRVSHSSYTSLQKKKDFLPPRLYTKQIATRVKSQNSMCFSLILPFRGSMCVDPMERWQPVKLELRREACASALRMLVTNNADNQVIRKAGRGVQDLAFGMVKMPGGSGPCWGHPSISPIAAG